MVFFNSHSLISGSSSSRSNTGSFLRRKRRKWPLLPYKGRWQQTYNQQLAMESLQKAAAESPQPPQQPNLLSALINSFTTYNCSPTPCAYSFIIKTLTHTSQFHQLPPILHRIQHVETFTPPEQIFVHLIRTYARANKIDQALQLFYKIPDFRCTPSAASLNALLRYALCKRQETLSMVPEVLIKSHSINIRMEESTFRILITALCKLNKIGYAVEMLNQMSDHGYDPDPTFYSLILSAMCVARNISSNQVLGFVEEMRRAGFSPNGMDYSNVISFLVKRGNGVEALNLLNQMKSERIKPDVVCYTSVLDGIISSGEFEKAHDLFDEMLVLGVVPDIFTYNVYVNGLCKQNNFELGFKMVNYMETLGCKPDVITYNTLIGTLCKVGEVTRALELLKEMELKSVEGNIHTYRILLDGLICEGEVVKACEFLEEMLLKEFVPRALSIDQMILGLCKIGLVSEALHVLEQMVDIGVSPSGANAWEALLSKFEVSSKEIDSVDFQELIKHSNTWVIY